MTNDAGFSRVICATNEICATNDTAKRVICITQNKNKILL